MTSGIRQRITNCLQRWPALYRFVSRIYWSLDYIRLKEHFSGTRAREKWWQNRASVKAYWDNRNLDNKNYFTEKISAYRPESILEIGCASGPSLYPLAKKYPGAKIVGIDINPEAVDYGNGQLAREGIANVKLLVGKADELEAFPDRSFDIVFTNACLIYIGPDKIDNVIKGMLRVARKGLIMLECYSFREGKDIKGTGYYDGGIWIRNYTGLLTPYVSKEKITVSRLPETLWPMRPWRDCGAITEVSLQ